MALSFEGAVETPHFNKRSFRYKKKIFATLSEEEKKVMVKLPLVEQSVFCAFDSSIIYPVPGLWGKQGATFINLQKIKPVMLKDALTIAWQMVTAKKRLTNKTP